MQKDQYTLETDEQATHPLVRLASAPDVEDGDWVEYDGYEWRATTEDGAYSLTLERLNPKDLSENIRVGGVSVVDVTVKE